MPADLWLSSVAVALGVGLPLILNNASAKLCKGAISRLGKA